MQIYKQKKSHSVRQIFDIFTANISNSYDRSLGGIMIDYSKLCQKVREALNAPIGNLEKDNQAAKKNYMGGFFQEAKGRDENRKHIG